MQILIEKNVACSSTPGISSSFALEDNCLNFRVLELMRHTRTRYFYQYLFNKNLPGSKYWTILNREKAFFFNQHWFLLKRVKNLNFTSCNHPVLLKIVFQIVTSNFANVLQRWWNPRYQVFAKTCLK